MEGHEEDVGAAVDGGGQVGRVHHVGGEAAGVLVLGLAEGLLIVPVAGAQHDHLHIHAHDVVDGGGDQIKALVAHQPGHAGHDGGVRALPQAAHLLQGGLAVLLARHLLVGEELGQPLVPPRVVQLGVDAVEDAPAACGGCRR